MLNELRRQYRACIYIANTTDSKREDAEMRQDAAKILTQLRAECKHEPNVILHSYYPGYGSWDESSPEERICLMCGVTEHFWNDGDHTWPNALARFEGNAPVTIKDPLAWLLSECIDVAEAKGYRRCVT